jgi:hypothetical protein
MRINSSDAPVKIHRNLVVEKGKPASTAVPYRPNQGRASVGGLVICSHEILHQTDSSAIMKGALCTKTNALHQNKQ